MKYMVFGMVFWIIVGQFYSLQASYYDGAGASPTLSTSMLGKKNDRALRRCSTSSLLVQHLKSRAEQERRILASDESQKLQNVVSLEDIVVTCDEEA